MKKNITDREIRKSTLEKGAIYGKCTALALILAMTSCGPDDEDLEIDKEAPKINLKQSSLSLEVGDPLNPSTLVASVTDDTDQNPQITASLDGQNISYQDSYIFAKAGDFSLKIKASDKSGNSSTSQVAINVGAGLPTVIGLDSLQNRVDPRTNIPMDLLGGIKALDVKDGDISANIKVFFKNSDGTTTEIPTPRVYVVKNSGPITLRYQIKDNNGNTVISEISLTIHPATPSITGIDKIGETINAATGVPMDLLNSIKALDCRNQDISSNIKVFLKNADGTYTQIENPKTYTVNKAGTIYLKYQVSDTYQNSTALETPITIKSGIPSITGIDKIGETINAATGVPMDLLKGIKALDYKNQDITESIKVFLKNADGTYTQIENPRIYTVNKEGTIYLKYQVSDTYQNSSTGESSLIVKQGTATITGLDQLPSLLNPVTGLPMNLLAGVKALDLKNQDITATIKVFIKNENGLYTQIFNPSSYIVNEAGALGLKYQVTDTYGNITNSEISLNITSGAPVLTGITNLQTALNPKTGLPMNLLTGVKALDLKNQDITATIKVFLKNADGSYTQITNLNSYIVNEAGALGLKYQVTDTYGNSTNSEISLNITSGAPVLTGITNLQTALNPKTGVPMDLLTGIKALDLKNQDITSSIKIFVKNADGSYTQISNPSSYIVSTAATLRLKYQVNDSYGNITDSEISLNITSGSPVLTGITNLQTALTPKTGVPMDLLTGIKALDLKNQDITSSIKIFVKNADGTYTQITNPNAYIVSTAGALGLKYQVTDNYGNSSNSEISLNITSGSPVLTGITNLQTALTPKTGVPMDLLTGIKALDLKNQDITSSIKVFLKNTDGTYTQITTPKSYSTKTVGKIELKYQVNDSYENQTSTETSLTVASGLPVMTGLDNLQTTVNPRVDIPMNLLLGVKALDATNIDISSKIKVYFKDQNGNFTIIINPASYIGEIAGILELKYEITDNYNQTTEVKRSINIVQLPLTIPKMTIMPTDPAFNPTHPTRYANSVKNWTDYLEALKVPEVRAMGEAMVRSGTNDMSKSEYLSKLNRRQVALNNGAGIPMGTDAEGQYVIPNTAFSQTYHEDGCNQILLGKKNNGVGSTGMIGSLIEQGGVNKAIWMEDGWMDLSNGYNVPKQVKQRLQNNPDKYLVISTSASLGGLKQEFKDILNTGRVVWFQSAGNIRLWQGQKLSISVTEQSATGDPREFTNNLGSYDLGNVTIPVQRVGGCYEDFTIDVANTTRGQAGTTYLTGDPKNIRYAPGVHAYNNTQRNNMIANKEAFTSIAAPVQTGLYYLLVAAFPELTPVEILEKMRNEYVYPVKVTFALEPTRGYTSKTTDVGKAYRDLNSKIPPQISLSSSTPLQIQKGRYKFNIIHGDGIVLDNGSKITQADIDNATKRGSLAQENYSISPEALKKLGKKAGDKIIIHVCVCSDNQEQYKQIRDIPYEITLTN